MQGCLQDNTQLACQVLHKLDWMLLTDPFQFRLLYEISVVCNTDLEKKTSPLHTDSLMPPILSGTRAGAPGLISSVT